MNWIRQNSFLAAFFGVTIVAAVALSVLLYLQYDQYSSVSEELAKQGNELKRLHSLAPYPSEDNLKKLRALREPMDAKIQLLQQNLAKMAIPSETVSPEQFQDRLRASVLSTVDSAKQNGIKLPDKFYLGFDGYQTTPPRSEAASALVNQMQGIELVTKTLIENRALEIKFIKRSLLNEEDQKNSPQKPTQPAKGPITKTSFEVGFKAEQNQVRKILNAIVDSNKQFFVIRDLHIANEKNKGPSKNAPDDTKAAAPVNEEGKAAGADSGSISKFILGTERVDVVAQIEMVKFKGNNIK